MDNEYAVEENDKLKEYCGIIGVFLANHDATASRLAYYGLQSLQHRGQESTGIAVGDGEKIEHFKGTRTTSPR
jgi:amidophosphoribosyltransferase